jgi:hypothetical protein
VRAREASGFVLPKRSHSLPQASVAIFPPEQFLFKMRCPLTRVLQDE